jgi:hypothetical protein
MNTILALLLAVAGLPLAPQSNFHDSRTPRTKDGKPNLAAPAPRLQGKPDLSGGLGSRTHSGAGNRDLVW